MKVLVAPDKFKGSLSAAAAAEAIARGWAEMHPGDEIFLAPMADGGEGFAEVFQQARGGEWTELEAQDPLGRPVKARYAWMAAERVAAIDMSETSGLWRLGRGELAPLEANTFGTGQLMRHAAERGARKILVGLGGSATTDGGMGMAAALGYEFYTSDGEPIAPRPRLLLALTRIGIRGAMALPEVIGACDVTNPLLGAKGAARVFSPQKGADAETVKQLEMGLENLAEVARLDLGVDFRDEPRAGAAGGFGFGLMTFCAATLRSGFELVAETLGLEEKIAACDLVITGEGRLDAQTVDGKGPGGLARLARAAGKPVLALAGSVEEGATSHLFDHAFAIADATVPLERAMAEAGQFLTAAAARAARLFPRAAGAGASQAAALSSKYVLS